MLQLPLMMVIITWLNCNTGLILRLLNNPSCWHAAPPPHPLFSCPTKATLRLLNKCTSPCGGVPAAGWQPVCECFWWGLILGPYKDGIRAQAYTTRRKIESLEGNMWLIPFCHQWILKIFSRSVKLFVNHNGGTVEISFNFQGQEVSREFKWGIVSYQSLVRAKGF